MTDTQQPCVTVAISTHNRAELLREAVAGVCAQTFADFEVLICDDASADDTPAVCRELAAQDSRVRFLRHDTNVGMAANWNAGLHAARGLYFAKLDDDNRYLPTFLERTIGALQRHPEAAFAFCDEWFMDAQGQRNIALTNASSAQYGRMSLVEGPQPDTALLACRQSCGINATVFRRDMLLALGGFHFPAGANADTDLFLKLAAQAKQACYIAERLAEYRVHEGQTTTDLTINQGKARSAVQVWDTYRFSGEAERIRRRQVSASLMSLSRALLLGGQIGEARQAARQAWRQSGFRLRPLAALSVLYLPAIARRPVVGARYGAAGDPGSG